MPNAARHPVPHAVPNAVPNAAHHPAAAWWAVCLLASGGAVLAWFFDPAALRWQPELALSQPWRAITAAWVHLSPRHLAGNLVGVALVAWLGTVAGCGRRAALAWLLAWPLTHLALLLQPALQAYGGLSGLMHAGVAITIWHLLRTGPARPRWIGLGLLIGLLAKLWVDAAWQGGPLRLQPGWDIAIAPLAHATGALAGALCAAACGVGRPPLAGASPAAGPQKRAA